MDRVTNVNFVAISVKRRLIPIGEMDHLTIFRGDGLLDGIDGILLGIKNDYGIAIDSITVQTLERKFIVIDNIKNFPDYSVKDRLLFHFDPRTDI